jgi:C1A family cysteine protease
MGSHSIEATHEANAQASSRWLAGRTSLSALSDDELGQRLGVIDRERAQADALAEVSAEAEASALAGASWPSSFDWRTFNVVPPVRDQQQCGSCVSFGSVAVLETLIRIQFNYQLDLSEGDLHFCSAHGANCNGWWPNDALDVLRDRGVCDEACCAYTPPNCSDCANRDQRAVTIAGQQHWSSRDTMKLHISTNGPLLACFDVYEDFYHYKCGVYAHYSGNYKGGHCVAVIGYDDDEEGGCWICKNSWGPGWGAGGFFKIGYGVCNIDNVMWEIQGPITIPWTLRPKDEKDTKDTKDHKDVKDKDGKDTKDHKDHKDDLKDASAGKEKERAGKEKEQDSPQGLAGRLRILSQEVSDLGDQVSQLADEVARGQAFIRPQQRPAIGEQAVQDDSDSAETE